MSAAECKRPDVAHVHADCLDPRRESVRLICRECDAPTLYGRTCMRCSQAAAIGQRTRIV